MTTIYRKLDLQTRKLEPVRGSTNAGGILGDANMLNLVIEVPEELRDYEA